MAVPDVTGGFCLVRDLVVGLPKLLNAARLRGWTCSTRNSTSQMEIVGTLHKDMLDLFLPVPDI